MKTAKWFASFLSTPHGSEFFYVGIVFLGQWQHSVGVTGDDSFDVGVWTSWSMGPEFSEEDDNLLWK